MKETRLLCMLMALLFSVLCAVPAQARWYGAEEGRFISVAPYSPDVEHPYVLCDNDPVNYIDPDGDLKIRIGDWEWGSGSTPGEWMGDFWDGIVDSYRPRRNPGQSFGDCFTNCMRCELGNDASLFLNGFALGGLGIGFGPGAGKRLITGGGYPLGSSDRMIRIITRRIFGKPLWPRPGGLPITGRGKPAGILDAVGAGSAGFLMGYNGATAVRCAGTCQ